MPLFLWLVGWPRARGRPPPTHDTGDPKITVPSASCFGLPCLRSPAWPCLASATGQPQPRQVRCLPPATSSPSSRLGATWSWASPGGSIRNAWFLRSTDCIFFPGVNCDLCVYVKKTRTLLNSAYRQGPQSGFAQTLIFSVICSGWRVSRPQGSRGGMGISSPSPTAS